MKMRILTILLVIAFTISSVSAYRCVTADGVRYGKFMIRTTFVCKEVTSLEQETEMIREVEEAKALYYLNK